MPTPAPGETLSPDSDLDSLPSIPKTTKSADLRQWAYKIAATACRRFSESEDDDLSDYRRDEDWDGCPDERDVYVAWMKDPISFETTFDVLHKELISGAHEVAQTIEDDDLTLATIQELRPLMGLLDDFLAALEELKSSTS